MYLHQQKHQKEHQQQCQDDIKEKSTSSLAAAALETADMTRRKERGVTGIPCWEEVETSSFEAKIASIRSRSDAEHRD